MLTWGRGRDKGAEAGRNKDRWAQRGWGEASWGRTERLPGGEAGSVPGRCHTHRATEKSMEGLPADVDTEWQWLLRA